MTYFLSVALVSDFHSWMERASWDWIRENNYNSNGGHVMVTTCFGVWSTILLKLFTHTHTHTYIHMMHASNHPPSPTDSTPLHKINSESDVNFMVFFPYFSDLHAIFRLGCVCHHFSHQAFCQHQNHFSSWWPQLRIKHLKLTTDEGKPGRHWHWLTLFTQQSVI